MIRLRIILNSKYLYILLTLLLIISFFTKKTKSLYKSSDKEFTCIVLNVKKSDKYRYELKCNEILIGYSKYYYEIGDVLKTYGDISEFKNNTNFNLFNYKKYYEKQGIFYRLNIHKAEVLYKSKNLDLIIKNIISKRIEKLDSASYLNSLILGNKYYLDNNIEDIYKNLGVIHIFSVSGMHIMFLVLILEKLFKNRSNGSIIIFFILFLYYEIIGTVSVLRSLLFFIIKYLNDKYYLNISKYKMIILTIFIMLFINIGYLYNIGFYYSIIVSSSLILFGNNKHKYISIPIICFIVTLPLNLYISSEINLISIIANIILIPIFTLVVYPLAILTTIFNFLDIYLVLIIRIVEYLSTFIDKFSISLVFIKPSVYIIVFYYLLIILFLENNKNIIFLLLLLILHYNYNFIFPSSYLLMFDVGNGDSFLISNNNYNILVDTGGNNYDIANNITIPVIKSYGIRSLDLVILSHGDSDHVKEFIKIARKIEIKKVYINNNDINQLESVIIKYLEQNNVKYEKVSSLIDRKENLTLHSRSYDNKNENDSSILNYLILNNLKILFMGDASSYVEEQFVKDLNIKDIDILKVSHHGSKTSTSNIFLDYIKPKYSLVSAGRNNRYGHPKKEVLERLKSSKIYRTDLDGSIEIKFSEKGYKIRTCTP